MASMNNHRNVPDIVIGRLPVYLRALGAMQAAGKQVTSSQELADWLGISSAQIRKDLSHFGEFGKQGTGYSVASLQDQLRQILHLNREWPVVVIGAGNIGSAIASYSGFARRGFRVVGVFDNDQTKIGAQVGSFVVQDATDLIGFVQQQDVRHAMLAVPAEYAQGVADKLVLAGVIAILNYAPINLVAPPHVHVEYIDPVVHLQKMTFYIA